MRSDEPQSDAVPEVTEASGRTSGSTKVSRGALIGVLGALICVIFVSVWAFTPKRDTGNAEYTTTTDPFVHIDRNQTVESSSVDENVSVSANSVSQTAEADTVSDEWNYSSSFDDVRGGTIYRASVDSQNSAYFDFPYQGGSTLTMTVRKHPQYGEDVIFTISKGQFVCGVDECSGMINYGSGPQAISLSEPTDNSSDTLFASNSDFVIDRLKQAKRIVVELPFYQEGNQQFVFLMESPLAWPPKGSRSEDLVDENGMSISAD